jgi:hypothetical protein
MSVVENLAAGITVALVGYKTGTATGKDKMTAALGLPPNSLDAQVSDACCHRLLACAMTQLLLHAVQSVKKKTNFARGEVWTNSLQTLNTFNYSLAADYKGQMLRRVQLEDPAVSAGLRPFNSYDTGSDVMDVVWYFYGNLPTNAVRAAWR